MKNVVMSLLAGLAINVLVTGSAAAQAHQPVNKVRDWAVFEGTENNNKVCWIITEPRNSRATRDGKTVSVNRSEIFLIVVVRPADNVKNEVSFMAGYPLEQGSLVKASVDGRNNFEMFTDGENAWSLSVEEDEQIVRWFRAGTQAQLRGVSQRGTETVDNFSLLGFTRALAQAQERCS